MPADTPPLPTLKQQQSAMLRSLAYSQHPRKHRGNTRGCQKPQQPEQVRVYPGAQSRTPKATLGHTSPISSSADRPSTDARTVRTHPLVF